MTLTTFFSNDNGIFSAHGRLETWSWAWKQADIPADAVEVTALEALEQIGRSGDARRIPIGVIGPREATAEQLQAAERIGNRLGSLGLTMICGGKGGVMEAVSKGCRDSGGLSVGMLPGHTWREANPYVCLPIATGLSEARNMIIAKSSEVVIAVGGSYGTLSEIAYGLHFSKPVIALAGAPDIDGVELVQDAEGAIERMAFHLFERVSL